MITAIAPGSYDPVTNGHIDVIGRAADIFDRVVVGVVGSPTHKEPMFSLEERVGFLREALAGLENVEVDVFSELVVEFARCIIVAYVIARFVALLGISSWLGAVHFGLMVWIGFPVIILTGSVLWENTPWKVAAIHAGDWLVKMLVISIIVTLWH